MVICGLHFRKRRKEHMGGAMTEGRVMTGAATTPAAAPEKRMGGPSGGGLPVFHKVGLPVRYRDHVTLQWHRAGDHWRLMCSGKPVADVVPDERYPCMYRVRLPAQPLTDLVNLSRARDAAFAMAGRAHYRAAA